VRRQRLFVVCALALAFIGLFATAAGAAWTGSTAAEAPHPAAADVKPVFIFYYLWWDQAHWTSHLGSDYPLGDSPDPLPATLNSSGCGTVNNYTGNQLTDVSQHLAYNQANYDTILTDVKEAAATGATGFAVNWIGTGAADQQAGDSIYNRRLADVFKAVAAVNASGTPFKVILNYQSSASKLTMTQFTNDFGYLLDTYGTSAVLDHTYSSLPEIVMSGTWKYSDSDIKYISEKFRSKMYLIGDEKPSSWDATRADYLDGSTYYWSSQNPYDDPASFAQLEAFAKTVREVKNPGGGTKTWLAPLTPGYNAMLYYDTPTCVPRDGGETMQKLYDGNAKSDPDGWTFISWNEISEGSYIVPLTRYGDLYVDTLADIIRSGS
jgi:hypothetical protein